MKKKIVFGLLAIFLVLGGFYFYSKFAHAENHPYFKINNKKKDNTLKIGIIGDSWVVAKDLNSLLKNSLKSRGIKAEVISSGNPGAMTNEIYNNLYKKDGEEFSSRHVIVAQPKYCIVFAGVNDSARHIGKEFYAEHLIRIIQTLLHYGITPIVVKLPNFGVLQDFEHKNFAAKSINAISEYVSNDGQIENTASYRKEFEKKLKEENLQNQIIYFDFDKVSSDYNKTKYLYSDPMHLNDKGYQILSEELANEIQKNVK